LGSALLQLVGGWLCWLLGLCLWLGPHKYHLLLGGHGQLLLLDLFG